MSAELPNALLLSRTNTVRITVPDLSSTGTGFFLDSGHVLTCYHVIAAASSSTQGLWRLGQDIRVTLSDGEEIPAVCITPASATDMTPQFNDFAVLRLAHPPQRSRPGMTLAPGGPPEVGADVLFSGFPLSVPTMVTHKGYLSGVTGNLRLLCIQAPVNKGSSGSALLGANGAVIGIVTYREGDLPQELKKLAAQIRAFEERKTGIQVTGIDPLSVERQILDSLDRYISPGIGYALNVSLVRTYLETHPGLLTHK